MSHPASQDRRQTADRRNAATRRRHADLRSVHIELCQSVLRAAIVVESGTDEPPTIHTRSVAWRADAPDLFCNQGRTELTAALRLLVNEERLAGCKVSIAISSALCVNRATSGATAKVEQEITELQDRSQLYLALGPGVKTTAVGRKHLDARHEHALITVTNERTLDLLVEATEAAGLVIDVIESALVAISRLHGRLDPEEASAVILAQLNEDRFEIGVCRAGELLLEYRPAAGTTLGQLGEVVDDHYERLKRYCSRQHAASKNDLARMWLVGEPSDIAATKSRTRRPIETAVLPMDRIAEHWRLADDRPIDAEMGAAVGLALRNRFEEGGLSPNLMDEIHARAKTPLRPFLLRAGAPIAATLLLAASLWVLNLEQQAELSALRERVEQAAPSRLEGKRLGKVLVDSATEIQQLSILRDQMPKRDISPIVRGVGQCLPDDVWLKAFRLNDREGLSLAGASYTEGGVYDFVRYLEEAPAFREVALRGTGADQTPQGPATSFDVDLHLEAAPAPLAPTGEKP